MTCLDNHLSYLNMISKHYLASDFTAYNYEWVIFLLQNQYNLIRSMPTVRIYIGCFQYPLCIDPRERYTINHLLVYYSGGWKQVHFNKLMNGDYLPLIWCHHSGDRDWLQPYCNSSFKGR